MDDKIRAISEMHPLHKGFTDESTYRTADVCFVTHQSVARGFLFGEARQGFIRPASHISGKGFTGNREAFVFAFVYSNAQSADFG
ncbi:hypothetical protein [Paraburkholderia megapolitana]|uniref:hypothetical protein n=1 Tax=Paraburkholderia megapolitana TaxID=420953 RepID=UPI0038BAFD2D